MTGTSRLFLPTFRLSLSLSFSELVPTEQTFRRCCPRGERRNASTAVGRVGLRKRYLKNDRFNAMPSTLTHKHTELQWCFYFITGMVCRLVSLEFGLAAIFCIVFQFGWYFDWQIGACHEHNYNASEVINDIRPDSRSWCFKRMNVAFHSNVVTMSAQH